jgi:hypothetical protein
VPLLTSSDTDVAFNSLRIMAYLARSPELRIAIADSGAIEPLVRLLRCAGGGSLVMEVADCWR